jgi:tetratricopeptide (TPR) repeat protein
MKTGKYKLVWMILFLIIFNNKGFSQNELFTVLAAGGKILLKKVNTQEWKNITTGQKIFLGDSIKISSNAYIGLAHKSLNTLELNKAGLYFADSLAEQLDTSQKSVSKKLVAFIIDEMADKKKGSNEMRTLGAVVRLSKNKIDVNLPTHACLFDTTFKFTWYPSTKTSNYVFQLLNPSFKTIYMKEISDTSLSLDLQSLNLQSTETYNWLVFDPENKEVLSDTIKFNVLSKARKESIVNDVYLLSLERNDEKNILDHLILASYYKNNKLYLEALKEYKSILKIKPDVDEFWESYLQFLIDIGLKREALNEWQRSTFANRSLINE